MAWVIGAGPFPGPWEGRDAVGWMWFLVPAAGGDRRPILVEVSGTAMATAPEYLPPETQAARESEGRSEVERFLEVDHPPERISLGTTGYIEQPPHPEQMAEGWWVKLDGGDAELREFARVFTSDEFSVVEHEGAYYARSTDFDELGDAGDVRTHAAELVRRANGVCRLARQTFRPIEFEVVTRVGAQGERHQFIELGTAIEFDAALEVVVIRADGAREEVEVDRSEPARTLELARVSTEVARVLRLLGQPDLSWTGIYHLYEVVLQDVGGRMFDEGWATQTEVDRFRQTANSPAVLGEDARHGREQTQPPANPMGFDEAKALVLRICSRWLEERRRGAM